MKILNSIQEIKVDIHNDLALTIGNFDGVHCGHQYLINQLKKHSSENAKTVVISFFPHPREILATQDEGFLIFDENQKHEKLERVGVDFFIQIPFTRDLSNLDPKSFLKQHLFSHPQVKLIMIGHDFSFGMDKRGDFSVIEQEAKAFFGQHVKVIKGEPKKDETNIVSSSLIRKYLGQGNIELASKLLGENFARRGLVLKGLGRGRTIGFPTANLSIDTRLIYPENGVYITQTKIQNQIFNSVTNIGFNPTFKDQNKLNVETYILDFDAWIYGEEIEIIFFKKIRDEKKFSGVKELTDQIESDVDNTKNYFK